MRANKAKCLKKVAESLELDFGSLLKSIEGPTQPTNKMCSSQFSKAWRMLHVTLLSVLSLTKCILNFQLLNGPM